MIIIKIISILFSLLLVACTSMPKEVFIPTPVNANKIDIPSRPSLPITALTVKSKPDEVAKAYVGSIEVLEEYNCELTHIIEAVNANGTSKA